MATVHKVRKNWKKRSLKRAALNTDMDDYGPSTSRQKITNYMQRSTYSQRAPLKQLNHHSKVDNPVDFCAAKATAEDFPTFSEAPPDNIASYDHGRACGIPRLPYSDWGAPKEIWLDFCWKENLYRSKMRTFIHTAYNQIAISSSYFPNQEEINGNMRCVLIDWMSEVCNVHHMQRATFHLAVDLVDRFLYLTSIKKNEFQLLGVTCLFIAAKFEEIYPPKLKELAYVTADACSESHIRQMETIILRKLKWGVRAPNALQWLVIYLQIQANQSLADTLAQSPEMDEETEEDTQADPSSTEKTKFDMFTTPAYDVNAFLQISQVIDLAMLHEEWLQFDYSKIAAAAIAVSVQNPGVVESISGYSLQQLGGCIQWMDCFSRVTRSRSCKVPNIDGISKQEQHHVHPHNVSKDMLHEAKKHMDVVRRNAQMRQAQLMSPIHPPPNMQTNMSSFMTPNISLIDSTLHINLDTPPCT